MDKKRELLNELQKKIDECDDLIVEISQVRYWLEGVVNNIKAKKSKRAVRRQTARTVKF